MLRGLTAPERAPTEPWVTGDISGLACAVEGRRTERDRRARLRRPDHRVPGEPPRRRALARRAPRDRGAGDRRPAVRHRAPPRARRPRRPPRTASPSTTSASASRSA